MTTEILVGLGAAGLSLLFEYFPGFDAWYEKLTKQYKRLFMAGVLFVIVAAIFGLSCAGVSAVFACTYAGAWVALQLWAGAVVVNQVTHLIIKKDNAGEQK